MLTQTAPAYFSLQRVLFAGLLVEPAKNELAPIVELARQVCAPLLRLGYNWHKAIVEPGSSEWAQGGVAEQSLLVLVPLVLNLNGPEFMFELVQEAGSGDWRMAYAYSDELRELSAAQRQSAEDFLHAHADGGSVLTYWK